MDLGEKLEAVERLAKLHSSGALSDEEYFEAKARLFGSSEAAGQQENGLVAPPDNLNSPYETSEDDDDSQSWTKPAIAFVAVAFILATGTYAFSQRANDAETIQPHHQLAEVETPDRPYRDERPQVVSGDLIGVWSIGACPSEGMFELGKDGTFGWEGGTGTWKYAEGVLTTEEDGDALEEEVIKLDAKTLTLKNQDGGQVEYIRCASSGSSGPSIEPSLSAAEVASQAEDEAEKAVAAAEAAADRMEEM